MDTLKLSKQHGRQVMDTDDEPRDMDLNPIFECTVLARLPSHTLYQCKLVSKTWLGWINSPIFVESHLEQSIHNNLVNVVLFNPNTNAVGTINGDTFDPASESYKFGEQEYTYSVVGSCYGLVCLGSNVKEDKINNVEQQKFIIYNPATRVQNSFCVRGLCKDDNTNPIWFQHNNRGFGFGCVRDINTKVKSYMLVFIKGREIHVYSVKSSSFKRIQDYSSDLFLSKCLSMTSNLLSIGVSTGSVVHWLLEGGSCSLKGVFSLDLTTEMQYETPLPSKNYGKPWLVPMRGRLHIVSNSYSCSTVDASDNRIGVNVWVMNKYGSAHDSWVHLFKVQLDNIRYSAIPISLKEGGRKVLFQLWLHQQSTYKKSFVWYDLFTQQRDGKELHDVSSNLMAVPCLDTLVDPRVM